MMGYTTSGGLPNLEVPNTVPYSMRRQHMALYRTLDKVFEPVMMEIMPSEVPVKNMADNFTWPKWVDAGGMSRFYAFDEPTEYIRDGVDKEMFRARLTKIGYKQRTDEFRNNFIDGLIDAHYRRLAENCIKYISRFIEYCTTEYLYGNTTVIDSFSNQDPTGRQLKLTADDASDASSYNITGELWSTTGSAKPYQDILAIRKSYADMKGGDLKRAYLGQAAVFWAELNDDLADRVKYTRGIDNGILGASVGGVLIRKVTNQKYKSDSDESAMIGYPGRGSLAEDTWASRNKFDMMRTSAGTHEWALFTGDQVGFTFFCRTNTEDENPQEPWVYTYRTDEPIEYRTRFERRFCPAVADWANYIIMDKIATI